MSSPSPPRVTPPSMASVKAAVTPLLRRHHCLPRLHDPRTIFPSHSSLISPSFPSLSRPISPRIARRSRAPPPRCLPRRRRTGEFLRLFLVAPVSSRPCAPNEPPPTLFGAPQRRHGQELDRRSAVASPSASCRRPALRRTSPTSPSSSPRRPRPRRHLAVTGATPEHFAGDPPEPSTTTATPLPGARGETPLLLP